MDYQNDAGVGEADANKTPAILANKPLTHNELLSIAFEHVRRGKLGPYKTVDLAVSSVENPIQMVLRHLENGRIKVANIAPRDGDIDWDTASTPWH